MLVDVLKLAQIVLHRLDLFYKNRSVSKDYKHDNNLVENFFVTAFFFLVFITCGCWKKRVEQKQKY